MSELRLADSSQYSDGYDVLNIEDGQGTILYRIPGDLYRVWRQCHPDLPFEEFINVLGQRYMTSQSSNTGPAFTLDVHGINTEEIHANALMSREESSRFRIHPLEREGKESAKQASYSEHYKGYAFEVVDIAEMYDLNFAEGNVLKYLLRWRRKDGLTDLMKARDYLNRLIAQEEKRLSEDGSNG